MVERADMHGKVVLITGATDGIGRVTAEALAQAGAEITLVARNPQKTAAVAQEIRQKTGNPKIEMITADLSTQSGVRQVAETFLQTHNRLDVLINNAGAVFMSRKTSQDGYEMSFALNHLAYFLLTHLLLDLLKASAPARIVNVSSAAHGGARGIAEDVENPRSFSGWSAYSQSKLANVLFTYELARRLQGTGVTVNALHPGFVATNFGRSNGGLFQALFRLFQLGAITPEQGAETSIYLASSPEVAGVTGKYFDRCKAVSSSKVSHDEGLAHNLWQKSLRFTGMTEKV